MQVWVAFYENIASGLPLTGPTICRISESLGMLCAGLFRTELIGSIVLQGLYVPLLMFVGFFQVRTDSRKAMGSLWQQSSATYGLICNCCVDCVSGACVLVSANHSSGHGVMQEGIKMPRMQDLAMQSRLLSA